MVSDRIQRRIDQFLDEADEAAARSDWERVRDRALNVLRLDPDNADAKTYLAAAEREPETAGSEETRKPPGEGEASLTSSLPHFLTSSLPPSPLPS